MKLDIRSTRGVGCSLLVACALLSGCGDDGSEDTENDKSAKDSGAEDEPGSDDSSSNTSDDSTSEDSTSNDSEADTETEAASSVEESETIESESAAGADGGSSDGSVSETEPSALGDAGSNSETSDAGALGTSGEIATADAAAEAGSEPPDEDALYAVVARVYGEEADQSYVLLTEDLGAGSLDLADAVIEVPGLALGTGLDESGALFVASDSASTVTRYDLSDEGELVEGDTVDFSIQGVAYVGEYGGQFQYVAPDKAYWFSGEAGRIIVWNPDEMTVLDAIELDSLVHEGEALTFSAAPIRRGNTIYTFAAWHTPPPALTIVSRTAVIAIDTETDEVDVVQDTRCGYVRDGVFGDDGQLYLVTEGLGAAVNYLNSENAPAPCILRFDPEAAEFDSDYEVDLNGLFGGDPAGMLVLSGGGQAFLRYLDPSLVADAESPMEVAGAPAWGWAAFTPGDEPSVEILQDVSKSAGRLTPIKVGGKVYVPQFVDGESTRFVGLGNAGPGAVALEVPGLVFSAVKLR